MENDKFSNPTLKHTKVETFLEFLSDFFGLEAQVRVWTSSPYFLHC
jgi:hypothetical protein